MRAHGLLDEECRFLGYRPAIAPRALFQAFVDLRGYISYRYCCHNAIKPLADTIYSAYDMVMMSREGGGRGEGSSHAWKQSPWPTAHCSQPIDQPRALQLGGIPIEREQLEPMTPVVAVNQSIHEPWRGLLVGESIEHLERNSRGPDARVR